MKYVYQIKERTFVEGEHNTTFGGIAFYSSKSKAMEDFKERFNSIEKDYKTINNETYEAFFTRIKEIKYDNGVHYEVIVEKHEVY